ncbi:MAG: dephospho-CoA kinase [Ruminococcus sp.]|jgi:dephospho-CoA kinase
MKIIGITGGVGSGKSEVIRYLERRENVQVLLADEAGHLLMKKGNSCYQPVLKLFGDKAMKSDGELDRQAIAAVVYQDESALKKLNGIIHPAVRVYIESQIEKAREDRKAYFFLEAALLLEEHYDEICDEVWYIYAREDIRRERLMKSRNYTMEKIGQIMANQLSEQEFARRCDAVIDNSGDFEKTKREIENRMSLL